jgi:Holliday junction resolvase
MRETRITSRILKLVRDAGWYAEKIHGGAFQATGIPDILACIGGRFIAIETKVPKHGRATDAQKYHLGLVRKAGGIAVVVTDAGVVQEALSAWPRVCQECLTPLTSGRCPGQHE